MGGAALGWPDTLGYCVSAGCCAGVQRGVGPDVGEAQRAVERHHGDHAGREFLARRHVLFPQVDGGLHTTRLDAVGADFVHRAVDAGFGAGAHRLHPRKALVAVLLQALVDVAAAEGAAALLRAVAFGLQVGQRGEAAQHDHLVEHTDIGKPAAQQLALGIGGAAEGLHLGGGIAGGAEGQGHGGEFVVHGVLSGAFWSHQEERGTPAAWWAAMKPKVMAGPSVMPPLG